MKYQKPPLTYNEQLELITERGLQINDEKIAIHYLENISYYRLSAYFLPFKNSDQFKPGVSFDNIINLYNFDRRLRILVLEAIEAIEVALRAKIIYHLSHKYGTFGYLDASNFSNRFNHSQWLQNLKKSISESSESFVKHYQKKYTDQNLPLWMALEIVSFGGLSRLFSGLKGEDQIAISECYELHDVVLNSWLHTLVYARNTCAHHARFWNRILTFKPKLPIKKQNWRSIKNNRVYCLLAIMQYLLHYVNPDTTWKKRLIALLEDHPQIDLAAMGFSNGWQNQTLN